MIILKVTKKQGLTLSLEDKFFEKLQGFKLIPPAFLGLNVFIDKYGHSQNFHFLSSKILSPGQFMESSNSRGYV